MRRLLEMLGEATGREALAEMRRLLEMLGEQDEELALAPQPSLQHLESLVAQVTAGTAPGTGSLGCVSG